MDLISLLLILIFLVVVEAVVDVYGRDTDLLLNADFFRNVAGKACVVVYDEVS